MATTTGEEGRRQARAERRLRDLATALTREAVALGGNGEITVRVEFRSGEPAKMDVLERRPSYLLGSGLRLVDGVAARE